MFGITVPRAPTAAVVSPQVRNWRRDCGELTDKAVARVDNGTLDSLHSRLWLNPTQCSSYHQGRKDTPHGLLAPPGSDKKVAFYAALLRACTVSSLTSFVSLYADPLPHVIVLVRVENR